MFWDLWEIGKSLLAGTAAGIAAGFVLHYYKRKQKAKDREALVKDCIEHVRESAPRLLDNNLAEDDLGKEVEIVTAHLKALSQAGGEVLARKENMQIARFLEVMDRTKRQNTRLQDMTFRKSGLAVKPFHIDRRLAEGIYVGLRHIDMFRAVLPPPPPEVQERYSKPYYESNTEANEHT